ncbi:MULTISPECIES: chalcone isomerase family protein [Flavobacterium]|uniref:Chalcone isomerase n=1 Tax=Flavobacterium panici TaxID=2654843 RepID=A0A9N8P3V9_9FLAO|nr:MULTISPECIES: chalcone isomerase family protein [Flavobacterium]KOP39375.1 chalcone isomerase [Flavobacterium sp. VMW]KRB57174.1 chalcone isomerase [Flavobacterium sp. Root186]OWU91652.1 chalcone isomerase [Flavobacterium sp. NLM]PUU70219.1 chalcone isomerase [Flavobacterium sp. WLB]UUF14998.1 chalcone isomerase family protein [Flavobacterium panici]
MKKILLVLTLLLTLQFSAVSAQTHLEVNGVTVPRKIDYQNKTLQLNGAGGRSKMWLEVYVQALYLSQLSQDPKFIIDSDTEMAIRIEITSSMVSSNKLTKAMNVGFEKSAGSNLEQLRPRIEQFKTYLSDAITEKDVFVLAYNPLDQTINVFKNEVLKGKVQGFDFKKALFGIWLSDKPVDETLKKHLLGI